MMAMGSYICVRLLHALVILALVTMLVFVIAQLIPGDAVMAAMASSIDMNDPAVVARVRHQFGLDQSILVQFGNWLTATSPANGAHRSAPARRSTRCSSSACR